MLKHIISEIENTDRRRKVRNAVLGLGYIAVEVEGCGVGLAANLGVSSNSCTAFRRAGTLKGSSAGELLGLAGENDDLSHALALATLNALISPRCMGEDDELFEHMGAVDGGYAAMVGLIPPVVRLLRERGMTVDVFDKRDLSGAFLRRPDEMAEVFSRADIIVITATAIINGSLSGLLDMAAKAREVILMGPSTPMLPEMFLSTPVTYLAGCRIVDACKAFDIIMEGGGTEILFRQGAMKKINRKVRT